MTKKTIDPGHMIQHNLSYVHKQNPIKRFDKLSTKSNVDSIQHFQHVGGIHVLAGFRSRKGFILYVFNLTLT